MAVHPAPQAPTVDDLIPGSLWVCTTTKGNGSVVKIMRVTRGTVNGIHVPTSVCIRDVGRGRDSSREYNESVERFLARHSPRRPSASSRAAEPKRRVPLPPRMTNPFPLEARMSPKPPSFELGSFDSGDPTPPVEYEDPASPVIESKTEEEVVNKLTHQMLPHGHHRNFSDEEIMEIYALKGGDIGPTEVARAYHVSDTTIRDIWRGRTKRYAEVVARLQASTPQPEEEAVATPEPEEPIMDVFRMQVAHGHPGQFCNVRCVPGHHPPSTPVDQEPPCPTDCTDGRPESQEEQVLPAKPKPPKITVTVAQPGETLPRDEDDPSRYEPRIQGDRLLFRNLAGAITTLLEYHGKPLPPFLTLDTTAMRKLVAEAQNRADDYE